MNNNLEFENEDPSPDSIEDNHPRTNYGEGYIVKETLEEFIEREGYPDGRTQDIWETGVRDGAKWQQERRYSEEDMRNAFENGLRSNYDSDFDIWFEQFKKK